MDTQFDPNALHVPPEGLPTNPFLKPIREKLSLWDRFFNRYRKTLHARGKRSFRWVRSDGKIICDGIEAYAEYEVYDRVTGSITYERETL